MSNLHSIETQQWINRITITQNGEIFKYHHNGKILEKSNTTGFYTLSSIAKLLNMQYIALVKFITSARFMFCIRSHDRSFDMEQYVYFIQYENIQLKMLKIESKD